MEIVYKYLPLQSKPWQLKIHYNVRRNRIKLSNQLFLRNNVVYLYFVNQIIHTHNSTSQTLENHHCCHDRQKNKHSPKIDQLRVIGIYEAEYNFLLKLYWPKLTTQHTERERNGKKNSIRNTILQNFKRYKIHK